MLNWTEKYIVPEVEEAICEGSAEAGIELKTDRQTDRQTNRQTDRQTDIDSSERFAKDTKGLQNQFNDVRQPRI